MIYLYQRVPIPKACGLSRPYLLSAHNSASKFSAFPSMFRLFNIPGRFRFPLLLFRVEYAEVAAGAEATRFSVVSTSGVPLLGIQLETRSGVLSRARSVNEGTLVHCVKFLISGKQTADIGMKGLAILSLWKSDEGIKDFARKLGLATLPFTTRCFFHDCHNWRL